MITKIITTSVFSLFTLALLAQDIDSNHFRFVERILEKSMTDNQSYDKLSYLCTEIGPRLSGSQQAALAVDFTEKWMEEIGCNRVFRQEVMVPNWKRGEKERAYIIINNDSTPMSITALGMSVATPEKGLKAEIIEVQNFEQLKALGKEKVKGKIVFYNRPMNPVHVSTFAAYGGSVDQRWAGASEAAKLGAVGTLVRSMTLKNDDNPHTGVMGYEKDVQKIPAAAISTQAAEMLHRQLIQNPNLTVWFNQSCATHDDTLSHNVVGEFTGSVHPEKYIVVGGHLDSWDLGQGAHDDGAGCIQSIEALRILKSLGYTPRHTLRAVMFMNEENGLRGGRKYAEQAKLLGEHHLAAIESDRGGFSPRGFDIEANQQMLLFAKSLAPYLAPLGIYSIKEGGSGADIGPLRNDTILLAGLVPDSQRYFDYHHAQTDRIEAVNERELQMGAATMAAFIYLIDQLIP
jgi:carboxypeptidase Q